MNAESKNFINLGVVLNEKGEVLLIQRVKEEKGKDGSVLRWAFPGGKQKFEESREDCVEREVLAETGYQIKCTKQISLRVHPQIQHVIIAYHLCRLTEPQPIQKPSEPHEVAQIKWVKPKEMKILFTTSLDPGVAKELKIA
ncbi:NUDIX hydrolase [Candidatus Microgenomates bacterium]|jgi:ADP-ribose pyrophosphatase YjhB (NUDIX family)|nr:MAG: NUDIX hydrolase [Candidatus Microgenomates bacterium]